MINNKKYGIIFLITAIVVFAIIAAFVNKTGINTRKTSKLSVEYDAGAKADFYTYNKNIYYLTKDGLQLMNENGESTFSDTFTMSAPSMIADSGVVAVTEKDGRAFKVYNESGRVSDITVNNPIAFGNVNSQGDCLVVSKGDNYEMGVYNSKGEKVFEGSFASDDGIPLCSDISDDGKILAVAFLDTSDIKAKSRVGFYSISQGDSKATQDSDSDFMFASFIEEDAIVGRVSFMQNNTLCSLSTKSLKMVSLDPSGQGDRYKEILSYEIKNTVTAADFNNKKCVSLAFGDASLNSENPEEVNSVKWFNSKGDVLGDYKAEKAVDGLNSGFDTTIISMGRQFAAVNFKGNVIWEYTAIQDVNKLLFVDNNEDVLLVGNKEAYSIDVNNTEDSENADDAEDKNKDGNDGKGEKDTEKQENSKNNKAEVNTEATSLTETVTEMATNSSKTENSGDTEKAVTTTKKAVKASTTEKKTVKTTEEKTTEKQTEKTTKAVQAEEKQEEKVTEKQTEKTTKAVTNTENEGSQTVGSSNGGDNSGPVMPE